MLYFGLLSIFFPKCWVPFIIIIIIITIIIIIISQIHKRRKILGLDDQEETQESQVNSCTIFKIP